MLELRHLCKTLPGTPPRVLFDRLSLRVGAGECVAIVGESGVGKSTLLNCIAGLEPADGGEIQVGPSRIDCLDDDAMARLRRSHFGFVFQAFHILPHLTLGQNVALPLALQGRRGEPALERAEQMLAAVGIPGRGGDFPRQLSGGEMQRVAIARALIHQPALLLADEPTGNLDPETANRVLQVFAEEVRRSGAAVVLVTHSEVAAAAADRTLILGRDGLVERPRA